MKVLRYFKASWGPRTYFRASATRAYVSLIANGNGGVAFSTKPRGLAPAVEIGKAEYEALAAVKQARVAAQWKALNPGRDMVRGWGNAPYNSWVAAPAEGV